MGPGFAAASLMGQTDTAAAAILLESVAMIELRPLREDECVRQHEIEVASYPAPEVASLARFQDRRARFPEGSIGAFDAGRMLGFICLVRTGAHDLSDEGVKAEGGDDAAGRDLVVLSVATDPTERRRGLGARLLEAAADLARQGGYARIRLLCKEHMIPWYAKHDYRSLGRSACTHGGAVWFEMERAVPQP